MRAIGIDFGTTNSAVAVVREDGEVRSLSWPSTDGPVGVFRTALYLWSEGRAPRNVVRTTGGPDALARALAAHGQGRFVQSIKTYLGSRAFTETRLFGRRFSIEDLVATFLRHLVASPEQAFTPGTAIAAGRPVVFAGQSPDEALAVDRLAASYREAGLGAVEFVYEPLGAAYWYARHLEREENVLVADFGGGTSDFSVIRFARRGDRFAGTPIAHGGVGVAGDTFDVRLIDHFVAPQLGRGAHYWSFGKNLPIPAYIHAAFSQWHQLSWLKTPATLAELRRLATASDAREALEKLIDFVELDLGFELYGAINALKIQLSDAEAARLAFDHAGLRLSAEVTRSEFERLISPDLAQIAATADRTLERAGLSRTEIDAVFVTGGTSQVPAVRRLFVDRFGEAKLHAAHPLQSVASGLALYAADRVHGGAR